LSKRFGITVDCHQPSTLAAFWCPLLGYIEEPPPAGYANWQEYDLAKGVSAAEAESGCTIMDPEGRAPRIYFQRVPEDKAVKNRVHLDIVAAESHLWADVQVAADNAVASGAAIVRESEDLNDRFIVMTDPEGNEFCLVQ
jgi:hypothetical protein